MTSSDAVVAVSPGMVETMSYSASTDMMLSGLFIGGMLAVILVSTVVMLIASFFMSGFILRVYRGDEELNFKNLGKMFWQGIVYFVIVFIYLLPYSIGSSVSLRFCSSNGLVLDNNSSMENAPVPYRSRKRER